MNALIATSDLALALSASAAERAAQATQKGIKGIMTGRSDTFRVNPFDIDVVEGFNLRGFDTDEVQADLVHLAQDIKTRGVQQSLKVRLDSRDNRLKLVDGERRLRATIYAINFLDASDITEVPVVLVRGKSDADLIAEQFASNTDDLRKDFNEVEQANGIQRLIGFGWDDVKIAAQTGLKAARVKRLVAILELPTAVSALVRADKVSATYALEVVKNSATTEAAVETLEKGLAVAAEKGGTKVMRKHVTRAETPALPGKASPRTVLKALAEDFKTADEVEETNDGATTVAFHFTPEVAARIKAALAGL